MKQVYRPLSIFVLLIMFFGTPITTQAQDTLAGWTFPNGLLSDTVCDQHNNFNTFSSLGVRGGAGPITTSNGFATSAATAVAWDNGMDNKYWIVNVITQEYSNIRLYSKQRAGGNNPGPRDFKVQYALSSSGVWLDIPNGSVTVSSDWTGVLTALPLPAECNNQTDPLLIRWIMTSNTDWQGGTVAPTGVSKIDDVFIVGDITTSVPNIFAPVTRLYPVPASGSLTVSGIRPGTCYEVINLQGNTIDAGISHENTMKLNLEAYPAGLYFLRELTTGKEPEVYRFVVTQ